ncbi:MAG: hypothetical protein J6W88_04790 [Bacteroidales bacterium]|nr:hypothetical protein [Bacteroidales bacterium]
MKNTTKVICGIVLLALGIGGALGLMGVIEIDFQGWWTLFVIVPSFVSLFSNKNKAGAVFGLGTGVLLLLATRDVILWSDLWKYIICLLAVIWGFSLIFCRRNGCRVVKADGHAVEEMKLINQDGRQIHKINVSFGRQQYGFSGQRFEGADVQTSFGFTALDLRNADLLDGAVVKVECSFGGMEIRVDRDVCVKSAVDSSFGNVENKCDVQSAAGVKTLYVNGNCSFGGIEIK